MTSIRSKIALALSAVCLAFGVAAGAGAVNLKEEIKAATSKFRDLTGTFEAKYTNKKELSKMGKSYARSYEFDKAKVFFKDPDKFKMEGTIGLVRVEYIINNDTRIVRIPGIRYSKKENLARKNGKKQTCVDVGILTDGIWGTFDVKYIGAEDGKYIIDLAPPEDPKFRQRIWIDAKNLYLCKREQYERDGDLRARYLFKDHKRLGGSIWVACRTEMYNPSGGLAGISELTNIKVNDGVSDSEFR